MILSIVIPALNEEKYLPRLLQSIKDQDFSDFEIIVSDGNSHDKTREIAHSFGAKVLIDERRGPARQRNAGAAQAQGEIILFLDADGLLPDKNYLRNIVYEFNQKQLAVAGFILHFDSPKLSYRFFGEVYNVLTRIRSMFSPIAAGAGIMIKKELHQMISGFAEDLAVNEDHDYVMRASALGRFGLLKSRRLLFSVRRIEGSGALKMLLTWIKMFYYDLIGKKVKSGEIDYKFGEHTK